jgi:hypothetical protein
MSQPNVELSRLIIFELLILTTLVFMYLLLQVVSYIIHLLKELFFLPLLSIFIFMPFFSISFTPVIFLLPYDRELFQAIFAHR